MHTRTAFLLLVLSASLAAAAEPAGIEDRLFTARDVFDLEYAADPQISPDGARIAYVRRSHDIMKDRARGELWIVDYDGSIHRPLTSGPASSPRWAPDGKSLVYVAPSEGKAQIHRLWLDTLQNAPLTRLERAPSSIVWSPDGKWFAFSMFVPEKPAPYAKLPEKPEGAEWAAPAKLIRQVRYRADGQGYLEEGFDQLFVIPAEGGSPRRLTPGSYTRSSVRPPGPPTARRSYSRPTVARTGTMTPDVPDNRGTDEPDERKGSDHDSEGYRECRRSVWDH